MRWPWVSRAHYALLEHNYREILRMVHDRQQTDTRYDALLDKYHALRLQGANAAPIFQPVIAKEPSAIDFAINEKAGSNHRLKLYLTGYAARERAANTGDADIVDRISNWTNGDSDE